MKEMPDGMMRDSALEILADIANDNLAERLRHEAAARILVAARRVDSLLGRDPDAARGGEHLVDGLAAGWDPRAVTALEYAEGLPVRVLDGLLAAAPRWARAVHDRFDAAAA